MKSNFISVRTSKPKPYKLNQFWYIYLFQTPVSKLRETRASQLVLVIKNPPANAGDIIDAGLIPGSGRSSGGGHGNPLQYSYLENPMDRGAWQAIVHRVANSRTPQPNKSIFKKNKKKGRALGEMFQGR